MRNREVIEDRILSRNLGRTTQVLNRRLNDQLECEVEVIGRGDPSQVQRHYERVAHWRIRLADWQASTFGTMQLFVLSLLLIALLRCGSQQSDVGRIFAVVGYVQMFALSLSDVPHLVQQWTRLRDISRRTQEASPAPQAEQ
jgi:hypothetical protein